MTIKQSGFNHERDIVNGKEEWLTPPAIIKALGKFDLDPCSPVPEMRPWNTAKKHYSIYDNGLMQPWSGRVWCNPPYGNQTEKWLERCCQHKNATALIFARTETKQFFQFIWGKATSICFIKGRISFFHVNGKKGGTSGSPSVLVTWDDKNANLLWDAVQHNQINGFFVDLRGGNTP